jgi:filamentous hemagglutinin
MSAANLDLNVSTLNQIGGALQKLNADGTVDQASTQQMLTALEQQLGSSFAQTTVSDHLHTDFVKEGGGLPMFVVAAIAIAASIITAGAAAAAFGVVMTQLSIGSMLIGALGGMVGSAVSQVASGQGFNLGQVLKAGAIGALSAGAMGALHLADLSSLHTVGSEIANGTVQMADVGNALVTIGERGLVTASVDTTVEGGSFGRAFEGGVIGDLGAVGASAIGAKAGDESSWLAEKTPGNVLAHAALACAMSAAEGTGCAGGAIGAGASAIASPYVRDALYDGTQTVTTTDNGNGTLTQTTSYNNPMLNTITTGIAALGGGLAAGLAGGNGQAGATWAENEVQNNTLSAKEKQLLDHAYSFEMPGTAITRSDAVSTLAALKLAQNDPNLTPTERGYFISASISAFQAANSAGVVSPNDAGSLVAAAIASMAFSGGGEGLLPSRASQSDVLPTTTGNRTAVSLPGDATNTVSGADSAANAANGARLNNQLAAEEIANGHAFDKHVIDQNEFAGSITTQQQFANQIEDILNNPSATKQLSNGRSAYWDDASGMVVIRNPKSADGGTAFKPTNGKTYFNNLR